MREIFLWLLVLHTVSYQQKSIKEEKIMLEKILTKMAKVVYPERDISVDSSKQGTIR